MKSLAIFGAAVAALLVAGCRTSTNESDGMMTGKNGSSCSEKKEAQCPFQAAAKKDDCCASEAKADKKDDCCASEAKVAKKDGGCPMGKSDAKAVKVKDCCKGKEISAMCADCKKCGEGSCDTEKKCDSQKKCEETKP